MKLKDRIYKIELDYNLKYPQYIHIDLSQIITISSLIIEPILLKLDYIYIEVYTILNDNPIKILLGSTSMESYDKFEETRNKLIEAWTNYTE